MRCCAASPARRSYLAGIDTATLDTPDWLMARWVKSYGADTARAIAVANGHEPALDLTVKTDPEHWAEKLGGRVLPTGSVRAIVHGPVSQLPGYADGAWWVQDAAAALPARLLGDVSGRTVADLCAAPGGKTAQLAAAGARVVAVDRAPARLERLRQNLARLQLTAELVAADVTQWQAGPFDAVLLDAPCSSTGTIRRHPDIPWLKRAADIAALAALQRRLIARAAELTKPGGTLVYCTCSLEPEEGVDVVRDLLDGEAEPAPAADLGGRGAGRVADRRRRPADAALPPRRPRFAPGRPRRLLRRTTPKDLKGLSAVGRGAPFAITRARMGPGTPARRGANVSMSRVSVAERTRLSVFLARGLTRRLISRVTTHPIVNWPFSFGKADRLLIAPQDLRTTDATRASEIYAGRFVFAGKVVVCDARSPFEIGPPSEDWAVSLLGFGWLRHLRAAESGITRANARALVDEWITLNSSQDPIAWRPDVVARRVISWLSQAPLVLDDSDVRFYRRFLRSLTRQVRHLRHTASEARDGVPRLQAAIALTYGALCMAGQQRHIRAATKRLSDELQRQILPDGGHISRNPGALIELLVDLLAAAHRVHRPQHRAAAGAAQRHRPHDADAALLPARRRQFRAVQRHGPDPDRPAHHHSGL